MTLFNLRQSLRRVATFAFLCALGSALAAEPTQAAKRAKPVAAKKAPPKPPEFIPPEADAEQIDAAERVFYGNYECEFNLSVEIAKDAKYPAYVDVKHAKQSWTMKPVLSATGAIRLEDVKGETLMVQISSKSMLLNVKTGRRIVDACVSEKQRQLTVEANAAKAAEIAASGTSSNLPLLAAPAASAATPAGTASAPR